MSDLVIFFQKNRQFTLNLTKKTNGCTFAKLKMFVVKY